jgi:hypothetical protein
MKPDTRKNKDKVKGKGKGKGHCKDKVKGNGKGPVTDKFNTDICNDDMTFSDCELAILRHAVDKTENIQGLKKVNSDDIQNMLKIVERFIMDKQLICYGGTAINNILPKSAQFYNRESEIPDYDFFSVNALDDAKELADIYHNAGYTEVEAKSGMHYGTFKVFVNYIPIADITTMHKTIYNTLSKEAIMVTGIKYTPPNYLRMSMYLELSRPMGDVSRWEKVMKRLTLLNKYYPIQIKDDCKNIDFNKGIDKNTDAGSKLNTILRDAFIDNEVVFFGGYSTQLYSKHVFDTKNKRLLQGIPDFDVLSEDPSNCAMIVSDILTRNGYTKIKTIHHDSIGDVIPEHIELLVNGKSMAYIYKPLACHSYNQIEIGEKTVYIATIDTILAFYLSFLYADMPYYDKDRLLCIALFLFNIEQTNRLEQNGILKRFNIDCYGKQQSLEDIRSNKSSKFIELNRNRGDTEYEMWFLKYVPGAKLVNRDEQHYHNPHDNDTYYTRKLHHNKRKYSNRHGNRKSGNSKTHKKQTTPTGIDKIRNILKQIKL